LVDPSKESVIDNLHASFTDKLLSLFLTSEEISKGFDPLAVLYDSDNDDREDDAVEEDFKYDSLKKKVMKKEKTSQMLN
jgi:hypothetical protein